MEAVWSCVLDNMKKVVAEKNIRIWLNPLKPLSLEDGVLVIGCPNKFFLTWIKENYLAHINEAAKMAGSNGASIKKTRLEIAPIIPQKGDEKKAGPVPHQPELPRMEAFAKAPLRFNRRYTFDRFVVGNTNNFAYSAAMAMATENDLNADSLFLLSSPGLGKSHLSQSIGHRILAGDPSRKVFYLTAEDFTNEMVYSIKNNRTEDFKNKYRKECDVLVLEEINFLSGKDKIQAELSYTLDQLLENGKKVVFTSTHLPKDIPRLRKNLASRLNSGVISKIKPPDYETRLRILRMKARENKLAAGDDIFAFLAEHLTHDVRQLESCLASLGAKSKFLKREVSMEMAREALKDFVEEEHPFDPDIILDVLCRYYKVSLEEMKSRARKKRVITPRNVGMYLFRETTELSLEDIGKIFGRNHSTVLYSLNNFSQAKKKDPRLRGQVSFLQKQVQNSLSQ